MPSSTVEIWRTSVASPLVTRSTRESERAPTSISAVKVTARPVTGHDIQIHFIGPQLQQQRARRVTTPGPRCACRPCCARTRSRAARSTGDQVPVAATGPSRRDPHSVRRAPRRAERSDRVSVSLDTRHHHPRSARAGHRSAVFTGGGRTLHVETLDAGGSQRPEHRRLGHRLFARQRKRCAAHVSIELRLVHPRTCTNRSTLVTVSVGDECERRRPRRRGGLSLRRSPTSRMRDSAPQFVEGLAPISWRSPRMCLLLERSQALAVRADGCAHPVRLPSWTVPSEGDRFIGHARGVTRAACCLPLDPVFPPRMSMTNMLSFAVS